MPLYKAMNIVRYTLRTRGREDAIAKVDWEAFGREWITHSEAGETSRDQLARIMARAVSAAERG